MYIIYFKETTILVGGALNPKTFATESAAKAYLTRMVNTGADRSKYAISDLATFRMAIEKQVTKKNLMSGKEFVIPINTPICCDPSSETYWSM